MKKQIFTLMVGATVLATSPAFGMERPEESEPINPKKILSDHLQKEIQSQKESPYGLTKALFCTLQDGVRMWSRFPFQGKKFEDPSGTPYYSTYDLQRIYTKEVNQEFVFSSGGSTGPASQDLSKLSHKFAKIIDPEVDLSYPQKTLPTAPVSWTLDRTPSLLNCLLFQLALKRSVAKTLSNPVRWYPLDGLTASWLILDGLLDRDVNRITSALYYTWHERSVVYHPKLIERGNLTLTSELAENKK